MGKNLDLLSSQILFDEAKKLGLNPKWEMDYGLFSVSFHNSSKREYFFHSNLNLNGELSRIMVKNKHFTRLILENNNFVNIPFILPRSPEELRDFFDQHQPIICKPLLGQRSKKVYLIKTKERLEKCSLKMNFFEKYIEGDEHRYLILDGEVIAVQHKTLSPTKKYPWNLRYTGVAQSKWDEELIDQSLKIASIFKLKWAAVDFLLDADGKAWVLEVNSSPGIVKIHHPDDGVKVNVAELIWKVLIQQY